MDTAEKVKVKARIENWEITGHVLGPRLEGNVYCNPRFRDGDPITTSTLVSPIDQGLKEGDVVETLNTLYTLGKEYRPKSLSAE